MENFSSDRSEKKINKSEINTCKTLHIVLEFLLLEISVFMLVVFIYIPFYRDCTDNNIASYNLVTELLLTIDSFLISNQWLTYIIISFIIYKIIRYKKVLRNFIHCKLDNNIVLSDKILKSVFKNLVIVIIIDIFLALILIFITFVTAYQLTFYSFLLF